MQQDPGIGDAQEKSEFDKRQLIKTMVEMGPIVLFGLTYFIYGLLPATAVLMAASVIALILSKLLLNHVGLLPVITAVVAVVFGGLTLWFQDSTYIKMKPTIIYIAAGIFLGFGLATGRNFLAALFGQVFNLTAEGWRILTIRWAVFFLILAILNEITWRNFSEETWVYLKLFGFTGLTFVFALAQIGLLTRHEFKPDSQE